MDMGMQDHGLTPGMERCNDARFPSDVPRIEKELVECVSYARKEQIGHAPYIQEPYRVKFMGQGEDHVVMAASQKSFLLPLKPLLYLKPIALRTDAMSARVVPLSLKMPLGARLNMTAKLSGPAFHKSIGSLSDMIRQLVALLIGIVCFFHYLLNGCLSHMDNECNILILFHLFSSTDIRLKYLYYDIILPPSIK
jgi:hypothetical protein